MEGLYDKYTVIDNSTGQRVKEATFTLIPSVDSVAVTALRTYAQHCDGVLAVQLNEWLDKVEGK